MSTTEQMLFLFSYRTKRNPDLVSEANAKALIAAMARENLERDAAGAKIDAAIAHCDREMLVER